MRAQMEQLKVLRGQWMVLTEPQKALRVLRVVNRVVVEVVVVAVMVLAAAVEPQRFHYFGFLQMESMAWDIDILVNATHHHWRWQQMPIIQIEQTSEIITNTALVLTSTKILSDTDKHNKFHKISIELLLTISLHK